MPIVSEGGRGIKGTFMVTPYEVSGQLIVKEEYNPQIRIRFQATGDGPGEPESVSLGVDIIDQEKAFLSLQPCCPGLRLDQIPDDETELRTLIGARLTTEARLAYVSNGFIQSFIAPVGTHRGTFRDNSLFLYTRQSDQALRCGISIRTPEGLESFWTMPWGGEKPAVRTVVGATPAEDEIEIFTSKAVWETLITLGFDYEGFMAKLKVAPALFTNVGLDGEIPGFFADHEDITPELNAHFKKSTKQVVEWKVVDSRYGIGPVREEKYSKVILTPVIVDDAEFQRELNLFLTKWDVLTQTLHDDADLRFTRAGVLTDEGAEVAVRVMKPVIGVHPDVVKGTKDDGSPSIRLPPAPETWNLNGLVAMTQLASKLAGQETLQEIVSDTDQLLAWAKLDVPELQDDLTHVETEEVEL